MDDAMRAGARKLAGTARWLTFEDPAAPVDQPAANTAPQGGYKVFEIGELTVGIESQAMTPEERKALFRQYLLNQETSTLRSARELMGQSGASRRRRLAVKC
ncbi:hypothetical protein [Saccharopolyspora shandongensis]|uniref:hypothetical protein n=1 Tax=Saccharopolyspora shandongensis TaxID=418495 RepID=UPI0033DCEB6D